MSFEKFTPVAKMQYSRIMLSSLVQGFVFFFMLLSVFCLTGVCDVCTILSVFSISILFSLSYSLRFSFPKYYLDQLLLLGLLPEVILLSILAPYWVQFSVFVSVATLFSYVFLNIECWFLLFCIFILFLFFLSIISLFIHICCLSSNAISFMIVVLPLTVPAIIFGVLSLSVDVVYIYYLLSEVLLLSPIFFFLASSLCDEA